MSAEAVTILDAMLTAFCDADELEYLESKTMFEDEQVLEKDGYFPYMNLDIDDFKIVQAGNVQLSDFERRVYPVFITWAVRNANRKFIKTGDLTSSFKGLFDIFDDIRTVILRDRSFGTAVTDVVWTPEYASNVSNIKIGEYHIGRAGMMFEVYKDVYVRRF